ncbi:hypothetical protein B0T20DRAFT_395138 [Sordaria brevicollis]|uniref:Uncharacterized protein n=1 Tax=Sordaria brevicollis TaxID=83679 RepID=A0AAE0PB41_SORBR|nr:hypothetical protein B0T20DRAFT_395138 [Sordaria brevicollis]
MSSLTTLTLFLSTSGTSLYLVLWFLSARAASGRTTDPFIPDSTIGFSWPATGGFSTWVSCYPGASFTTQDSYWRCCYTMDDSCGLDVVTKCESSTEYYKYGTPYRCSGGLHCATATVWSYYYMEGTGPNTAWLSMGCVSTEVEHPTYYRSATYQNPPPEITSTSPPPSFSSIPMSQDPSHSTPTSTSLATTRTSSSIPVETSGSPPAPAPSSKTWIAGAVAGPVAAITALGALVFWLKRRKAKRETSESRSPAAPGPDGLTQYHEAPVQSPKGTDEVSELPLPWSAVSELPARERPVELRSPSPVYEVE